MKCLKSTLHRNISTKNKDINYDRIKRDLEKIKKNFMEIKTNTLVVSKIQEPSGFEKNIEGLESQKKILLRQGKQLQKEINNKIQHKTLKQKKRGITR